MFIKILNKFKLVCLSIQNKLPIFLGKIFTKSNLNKVIIIFIVGFISRVFIVNIYNVNVYFDYFNCISILYYSFMSCFIVVVHELINCFNVNIIPSFSFIKEMLISMNKYIFSYKLEDIKISSIIKGAKYLFTIDKATIDVNQSFISLDKIAKILDKESYILEKNGKDLSNEPVDRFLSEEEANRLRESRREASGRIRREGVNRSRTTTGLRRGEITRLRREELLASQLR
jgi:hypothetical protein